MTLTSQERALVARARAFADQDLVPAAEACERDRAPDLAALRAAAGLGLTSIQIPGAQGGLGMSFAAKSEIAEALARACFGFSMAILNTHNTAWRLAKLTDNPLAQRLFPPMMAGETTGCAALTEPGAGSDFASIATRAERIPGGWRLNGAKAWITNAQHASVAICFAQTGTQGDGAGIGAFIVEADRPGFSRTPDSGTFAIHANGIGGFSLTDYEAPEEALIMEPGAAFRQIMSEINGARIYVAAMCLGMVDAALDSATAYGKSRNSFGKPLGQHQGWRWRLAGAEAELAAARALVRKAEAEHSAGEDTQLIAAQAKYVGIGLANKHIPELLHAHGASGLKADSLFSRHIAGMQAASFADGSTEIMLERIGRLARP
ncbi:Acyl-CoA dehydrogenase [Albimonas donghaensis]|uniref:Medium-chain specific acyl-CoA dehydrogenase, mitochondrial n=1 Tax=Albimonas donghaensis TaxID=356660 RepID=A0A1H2QS34_9RHOB|nr:acyl-CoA dehydrogenase family protein [Albimonas donghaensis]SDW10013.1 Acyl-CoA dehydrogenase [Albimonas donghaensis]